MSKYNIHATKADWQRLYDLVAKFPELDVKWFKKSQNIDGAIYDFCSSLKRIKGITIEEVLKKYPVYVYDGAIKATMN